MKQIAVYAGRFQPFGPHHKRTYDWMCERFGEENCYISTSNRIDENSPLDFSEKCLVMNKFGITSDRIIRSPAPYRPTLENVNQDEITLFLIIGSKDESNINYFKKDGSCGYFKEYYGQRNLETMTKSGYVMIAPHTRMNYGDREISGTVLREILPKLEESEFLDVMGWYDPEIHELFKCKFDGSLLQMDSINQSGRKHIQHVYEDAGLSYSDITNIFSGILTGKIECYEKFDGVHLEVTYKNGVPMAARAKTTVINPMTIEELSDKFKGRDLIQGSFVTGMKELSIAMKKLPESTLRKIESDNVFFNVEILDPANSNVYTYDKPYIVLHGLIRYDNAGNEIGRSRSPLIINQLPGLVENYTIVGPNKITVPKMGAFAGSIASLLNTVTDRAQLERIVTKLGYKVLKNCTGHMSTGSNIAEKLSEVSKKILDEDDQVKIDKYFDNCSKVYPNIHDVIPFEGIVFEYSNKTYKLTGSYRYINQIMGLYRY